MDKTDWSGRGNSFSYFLTFVCVSVSVPGVVVAAVEVNGKLVGADSLPQCESQGSNPVIRSGNRHLSLLSHRAKAHASSFKVLKTKKKFFFCKL